ncbi:hypothetical protein C0993_002445 [Termitomyces sp. T159_Od127]|nr:hypothetical protein C0993_002445 [Termitomyces sp. T159_Od127]
MADTLPTAIAPQPEAKTGCTGQRDKAAYVPMNKYTWGTMMNDYVFLEDIGRRVGDWGKEIVKGGYGMRGCSGAVRGRSGEARGRGRGRVGGHTKRDLLKMQLEARDVDMDILPVGMERRKLNQSYWEPKSPSPSLILLTHRNNMNTPLLNLAQQAAERTLSKKNVAPNDWLKRFLFPDPDDPESFKSPHFVMEAHLDPLAAVIQKHKKAYFRFDSSQSLLALLRNTHFVEFPTIEVWEEFNGTVVDVQGVLKELPADNGSRAKRRKLSERAGKEAINGLLEGYGSDVDEEEAQKPPGGLALLGGYAGSDYEDGDDITGDTGSKTGGELEGTDDEGEVEINPEVLVELMRHAHGDEKWAEKISADDNVDWGALGDEGPE